VRVGADGTWGGAEQLELDAVHEVATEVPAVGLDASGRATVAWASRDADDLPLLKTVRFSDGAWNGETVLARGDAAGAILSAPQLLLSADGGALIVWSGNDAGQPSALAWSRSGDGGYTPPEAIPQLDAEEAANAPLTAGTADDALAVWAEGDATFAAARFR
jgi:hypothetical protein